MASFSSTPSDFLSELEVYLEKGPKGKDERLSVLPGRLAELPEEEQEKAIQLLATALGKYSMLRIGMIVRQSRLIVCRRLANTFSTEWHPHPCPPKA